MFFTCNRKCVIKYDRCVKFPRIFLHTMYKYVLNSAVKISLTFDQYFAYYAIILRGAFSVDTLYLATSLVFKPPGGGVRLHGTISVKFFPWMSRMAKVTNDVETLPLSRTHERYRQTTDDRRTGGST